MSKNSISKTSMDEYPEVTQADFDRAVYREGLKPAQKKQRMVSLT
ncbi:conserved hypothetical protein [delta proteobacterium NaphS2]|nr:conserved hypothetical protein [delta proteobacterium NaphS2]